MWKWLGAFLILGIGCTIPFFWHKAQEARGFVQNSYGERISWKGELPVTMYLHESVPDKYIPAIKAAAATWDKAVGRSLFNIVTEPRIKGPAVARKDGKNVIYFMQTWEANRPTEQGRTSLYWVGDQIQEADIRIDAVPNRFDFYFDKKDKAPNGLNIEALMLHELGHVLGLRHKDDGPSVMATYLANDTDRIRATATDISDLRAEY